MIRRVAQHEEEVKEKKSIKTKQCIPESEMLRYISKISPFAITLLDGHAQFNSALPSLFPSCLMEGTQMAVGCMNDRQS